MATEGDPSEFRVSEAMPSGAVDIGDPEVIRMVGRRASHRDGSTVENAGEGEVGTLLRSAEAARLLGWDEEDVKRAVEGKRLLAVRDHEGNELIPAFQTRVKREALEAIMPRLISEIEPVCMSQQTVWLWFLSPKEDLGGELPLNWILREEDPERLLLAARRDAARLGG